MEIPFFMIIFSKTSKYRTKNLHFPSTSKYYAPLYKAPDFWGLHRSNYAFRFTFFKNVSVSFVVSLTIKRNITLHERATDHIWFIESMGFPSRSYGTLLHFVFFAQNIF